MKTLLGIRSKETEDRALEATVLKAVCHSPFIFCHRWTLACRMLPVALFLIFVLGLLSFSWAMAEEENYGTQNFMEAVQLDDVQLTREKIKDAYLKMYQGIRAGREEQVNRAVERRAAKIENPELKALLFFTLSEAYADSNNERAALFYLDRAVDISVKKKAFYLKKKESFKGRS